MAKNRYINTKFWTDPTVRKMSGGTKLLWLYLLTNSHSNIAGIYELPKDVMQFESGVKDINKSLKELMEAKKIIYHENWLVIVNFVKHQNIRSARIISGIHKALDEVPSWIMDYVEVSDEPCFNIDCTGLFTNENSIWIHYRNFNFNLNLNLNLNSNSETEVVSKPKTAKVKKVKIDVDALFDAFWEAYPRKVNKESARKSFMKIEPTEENMNKIANSLAAYKQSEQWQTKKYIPHAGTWLNQKRYNDDPEDVIESPASNQVFE